MSCNSECVKGGISLTWKIENFQSITNNWHTCSKFEWPKTKSKWLAMIYFSKNGNFNSLTITKLDDIEPFILIGTILAVNGTFCSELKKFDRYDFKKSQNSLTMINFQNHINDDSLTLRFQFWDSNINNLAAAQYFLNSKYAEQKCSFQWILNGDRDWKRKRKYAEYSIEIPRPFTDLLKMQFFTVTFNLRIEDHVTFANLTVTNDATEITIMEYSCKLKIQRKEGNNSPILHAEWSKIFKLDGNLERIIEEKWDYDITEWLINIDIIVVSQCFAQIEKISYKPDIQCLKSKPTALKRKGLTCNKLQQCMHKLYKEGEFCDVVLRAEDETFRCHKVVLCARSSVFKTMFENDMVEKKTNIISIDDAEPRILNAFLTYLYSDNLEDEEFGSAVELYRIADKYAVLDLQEKCSNIMISCLSTDNVCEVLDLADSHQDDALKEEILSFFYGHKKEIVKSASWKMLFKFKPSLAAEILQAAVTNML